MKKKKTSCPSDVIVLDALVFVKRRKGISKTSGKPYDFYTYKTRVKGQWHDLIKGDAVDVREIPQAEGGFVFKSAKIQPLELDIKYKKATLLGLESWETIEDTIENSDELPY